MWEYKETKKYTKEEFEKFKEIFLNFIDNIPNRFHPFVWINGEPKIGKNVYIGGFSEVNAKGSTVEIGDNCDISSFVAINVADSHEKCIGLSDENKCRPIIIENNVFVGSHTIIGGNTKIGHHSVIGAQTKLMNKNILPYSLVFGDPCIIKPGYYKKFLKNDKS